MLLNSSNFLQAQKFQMGLSAGINGTFAKKGASEFDENKIESFPLLGIALSVPVYLKLNEFWYLRSAFSYQFKEYGMLQNQFDIPLGNSETYFSASFNVFEIPLLLAYMPKISGKYKVEFSTGMVISSYEPISIGVSSISSGMGNGSISLESPAQIAESTISPDVNIGINLVKFKENLRRHQFGIAYQIGLAPTSEFRYSTQVRNDTQIRNSDIILKPRLNTLILTYTFFPKKLCF
jgi:hypothetical protein